MATQGEQPRIPMEEPEWTKAEKDKFERMWVSEGENLAKKNNKTQWDLGDWLLIGERRLLTKAYRHAVKITGLAKATLWDIKGVAHFFHEETPSRRRELRLSWSHHKELKKVNKDEEFLNNLKVSAAEKGWSVKKLRDKIEEKLNADKPAARTHIIHVPLSLSDFSRLKKQAKKEKVEPATLAAQLLSDRLKPNGTYAKSARSANVKGGYVRQPDPAEERMTQ
jgi:hypothetical protein